MALWRRPIAASFVVWGKHFAQSFSLSTAFRHYAMFQCSGLVQVGLNQYTILAPLLCRGVQHLGSSFRAVAWLFTSSGS